MVSNAVVKILCVSKTYSVIKKNKKNIEEIKNPKASNHTYMGETRTSDVN